MQRNLKEIAELLGGELVGDPDIKIRGISGIDEAKEGELTFLANPKYLGFLDKTKASAIITSREINISSKPIIRTDNPSLAFVKAVTLFSVVETVTLREISPKAFIANNVSLGKGVAVGPGAVIEEKSVIGDNTVIYSGVFIGKNVKIGNNCLIYSNVSIRENILISNNVIIHSNAVIGSDGFGFVTVEGLHHKIPQVGTVVIEDDVEIGAGVCIDRARLDKTIIGKGTKVDNLVHIAHNVSIGKNCLIVAQVGISGSAKIGDNVILAGQAALVGHITVGDNCVVMARSGVNKSIPANTTVWGTPAKPVSIARRISACMQNLPKLFTNVAELKKKIEELESNLHRQE
ncbi:MAG: UDP-3-O-(3-hydroxymyristoyl)glucosamine N-acyltransferase [Candidatus Omnitrophica bacterium]|nr:UDP-3-O-(3-hydroxymyristoyl)glucosamine N-acyltransferase [Candidatus Omnitrophota bacterium]